MDFVTRVYFISVILLALGGLVFYFLLPKNEKKIKTYQILVSALVLVAFYENLAFFLGRVILLKNHWVYNIFFFHFATWINLFLLMEITYRHFFKKIIIGLAWILLICSGLPYALGFLPFNELLSYSAFLSSSLMIVACGLFFYDLLSNDAYLPLKILRYSGFWIATLLLLFYSANFVIFLSLGYLAKHHLDIFATIVILPKISGIFVYFSFFLTLAKWKGFINYEINATDVRN